jgi:hypothetical protein
MALYPQFCSWIQEVLPSAQPVEDIYFQVEARLEPVLISHLRQQNVMFYDTDIADCRDKVFERMEDKLDKPAQFSLKLALRTRPSAARVVVLLPGAGHASFVFELSESPSGGGYMLRLVVAGRVVWENSFLAEQVDGRQATLAVQVPAYRLRHGESYRLELEASGSGVPIACQEFSAVHVTALHLLRAKPFLVVGYHPDLEPLREYRANLRDMCNNSEVATLPHLKCSEDKEIAVPLSCDQLGHEQDTVLEISTGEPERPCYFSCVRAVRHESLRSRMGFVTQVARTVAHEFARADRRATKVPLEDLSWEHTPAWAERRQSVAYLLAKNLIKRMSAWERELLIEHQVHGMSWAEIAASRQVSEDKVRQDCSRALSRLARALLENDVKHAPGAAQRIVVWLKEMVEHIVADEGEPGDA